MSCNDLHIRKGLTQKGIDGLELSDLTFFFFFCEADLEAYDVFIYIYFVFGGVQGIWHIVKDSMHSSYFENKVQDAFVCQF